MRMMRIILFILIATTITRTITVSAQLIPDVHYALSNESIKIIKEHDIIIGQEFFKKPELASQIIIEKFVEPMVRNSIARSRGMPTQPIRIAFLSHGGNVRVLNTLMSLGFVKNEYVICTIGVACSAAFTYMMHVCDERRILPNAVVLTHPVVARDWNGRVIKKDTLAIRYTREQSDSEAKVLNIEKDKWYDISRNTERL